MRTTVLKFLPENELKILKQIIIVTIRNNIETELGSILYTRPLTQDYNLKEQQDDNDKKGNSLKRFFREYPEQKNYPGDELDFVIFDAVKRAYPKSIVRNHTIFFNVDLDKIKILKNRIKIKSTMYFSPEFSNISNIFEYAGKTFSVPTVSLDIHSNYSSEALESQIFYANYNVTDHDVLKKLDHTVFE